MNNMKTKESTPSALANALAETINAASRLLVKFSDFALFDGYTASEVETSRDKLHNSAKSFDFIASDLPIGMMQASFGEASKGVSFKARQNWIDIYNLTSRLNPNGLAVAVLEPAFWSKQWKQFVTTLNANGVYLIGVVRFSHLSYSNTTIQPTLGVFSRQQRDSLFVADADANSSARVLAEAISTATYGKSIGDGLAVSLADFRGVDQLKVENEIRGLETQYKAYKHFRLVPDLASAEQVVLCKSGETYSAHENAIYIPRIGNSAVIAHLDQATLKHHNYIQVILSSKEVSNEYLAIYFGSQLGRLTLRVLHQGAYIPHLPKSALETILVPIPDAMHQNLIVDAHARLTELDRALAEFRRELSVNPHSASSLVEHANAMLQQVHRLSDSDKILALIRSGESRTLEFKETLSLDIRKGTKESYIENMVLKTIAAFLNSQGGTLLVGITDDGLIKGIRKDMESFFKGNRDDLLKHFKNILRRSIGETFYPIIDYDTVEVEGELVLRVDCLPSDKECFIDSTEFYVRTNPATDKLEGQKMIEYIRLRFKT
jgi:hypothetical protein